MSTINIIFQQNGDDNMSPGSRDDLSLNLPVTVLNQNPSGITSYLWQFIDIPDGSNATIDSAASSVIHFTPDIIGTYLIKLSINSGSIINSAAASIKTVHLNLRLPAAGETIEFGVKGWSRALISNLKTIDDGYGNREIFDNIDTSGSNIMTIGNENATGITIGSVSANISIDGYLGIPQTSAIFFNGVTDFNWRQGINLPGSYTKHNVGGEGNTLDIIIGGDGADGFTIGNTHGDSVLEINNDGTLFVSNGDQSNASIDVIQNNGNLYLGGSNTNNVVVGKHLIAHYGATINDIIIDISGGATTGQSLIYDGTKFLAGNPTVQPLIINWVSQSWSDLVSSFPDPSTNTGVIVIDTSAGARILNSPANLDNIQFISIRGGPGQGAQLQFEPGFTLLGTNLNIKNYSIQYNTTIIVGQFSFNFEGVTLYEKDNLSPSFAVANSSFAILGAQNCYLSSNSGTIPFLVGNGTYFIASIISHSSTFNTIISPIRATLSESLNDSQTTVIVISSNTSLNGAINSSITTITVTDTSGFNSSGVIQIQLEQVHYSNKTSTTFLGCSRGYNDTSATSHLDTTNIYDVVTFYFPSSGEIQIDNEVISYGSKTAFSFDDCQRAQENTTAVSHNSDSYVIVYNSHLNISSDCTTTFGPGAFYSQLNINSGQGLGHSGDTSLLTYKYANPSDWITSPQQVAAALDELGARQVGIPGTISENQVAYGNGGSITGNNNFIYSGASLDILGTGVASNYGQTTLRLSSAASEAGILINNTDNGHAFNLISTGNTSSLGPGKFVISDATNSVSRIMIDGNNIGIGTTSPNATLDVNGSIHANSLTLDGYQIDLSDGVSSGQTLIYNGEKFIPSTVLADSLEFITTLTSPDLTFISLNVIYTFITTSGSGNYETALLPNGEYNGHKKVITFLTKTNGNDHVYVGGTHDGITENDGSLFFPPNSSDGVDLNNITDSVEYIWSNNKWYVVRMTGSASYD